MRHARRHLYIVYTVVLYAVQDGFHSELIFQIAAEIRVAMPAIFKELRLLSVWYSLQQGIPYTTSTVAVSAH